MFEFEAAEWTLLLLPCTAFYTMGPLIPRGFPHSNFLLQVGVFQELPISTKQRLERVLKEVDFISSLY